MPRVLAIEPNSERGSILRTTLDGRVEGVLVVDSNASAIESLGQDVPDLVLLSALLSPSDEDELFECLRSLPDSTHVQTLTIPQIQITTNTKRRSKFALFGGRRNERDLGGCEPEVFAQQVREYLDRAQDLKADTPAESDGPASDVGTLESDGPTTVSEVTVEEALPQEVPDGATTQADDAAETLRVQPEVADSSAAAEDEPGEQLDIARAEVDDEHTAAIARIHLEAEARRDEEVRKAREDAAAEAAEALGRLREEAERQASEGLAAARREAEDPEKRVTTGSPRSSSARGRRPRTPGELCSRRPRRARSRLGRRLEVRSSPVLKWTRSGPLMRNWPG